MEKPEDGFRVFCLGGSTVRGRPYTTESSFTRWMGLELAERSEGRTIEAINCGGLSYASYRLRPIVAEVLGYQPDLVVVATGHNEFLEDRSYQGLKDRNQAMAWLEDGAMSLRTVTLCRRWLGGEQEPGSDDEPSDVVARLDEQRGFASYERDRAWQDEVVAVRPISAGDDRRLPRGPGAAAFGPAGLEPAGLPSVQVAASRRAECPGECIVAGSDARGRTAHFGSKLRGGADRLPPGRGTRQPARSGRLANRSNPRSTRTHPARSGRLPQGA